MPTLLFFDDRALAIRENAVRRVGRPALIPESIWHDDPSLSPTWGYPGVFFHEADGLWRMAYQANIVRGATAYMDFCKLVAESEDGFRWRPRDTTRLFEVPNRRFPHQVADGETEWCGLYLDKRAPADERVKRIGTRKVYASPDGLRWKAIAEWRGEKVDAPMWAVWNEVFGRHFLYARPNLGDRRIALWQTDDWRKFDGPVLLLQPDSTDEPLTDSYGMPVFPYEGIYVGFLWLYHGMPQLPGGSSYRFHGGKVECQLAYSLNGLAWQRGPREPFIPVGEPGSPDSGSVYPSSLVLQPGSDEMRIYASACTCEHGMTPPGSGSIVAYRLRKDGFVFLESRSGVGRIATKPLLWGGGELALNVQAQGPDASPLVRPADTAIPALVEEFQRGDTPVLKVEALPFLHNRGVRVQVTEPRGQPIPGYGFEDCAIGCGDFTGWQPSWKGGRTLDQLKGRAIQVAVEFNHARLYALRGNFQLLPPGDWTSWNAATDKAPLPPP
ncbi:MAG: hypothetical protein ACOYMV_13570, partial [Verrucomicrobiia bacterium]